ncbi:C39 family peptidase [Nocardioides sp. InS609-2]|uniref:C39 family peptidase n=1 Tax=Nocardioides sp. InS609-2 TaxID=2760705 RepID=UPI0020BE257D|nr:C39 family peptidase [Nocardioides sp. InS609-2]
MSAISYGGRSRVDDPRWPESGAPDLDAYATWSVRWCGMACLRMVLLARDGHAPTLYDLTMGGLRYGAYSNEPGQPQGLIYGPFADYAGAVHSLEVEVVPHLEPARLVSEVGSGHMVIASVHPEIRRPHRPPPGKGGHLVLVTSYTPARQTIGFMDPAGHTARAARASLVLPVFETFFANRGVVLRGV